MGRFHGKPCAVKQVLPTNLDEMHMTMFREEMVLCAKLHHPSIIRFYGWYVEDGHADV